MSHNVIYNTQRESINISEHGRVIQEYIKLINATDDRIRRNYMAKQLIKTMILLNPSVKMLEDYEHKLWDHLYIISDYSLDVDSPFPMPKREEISKKPESVPYKDVRIKFRFYGRNLQKMIESAGKMPEGDAKNKFMDQIASFMVNSSRNWNEENLETSTVADHIKTISNNEVSVDPEALNIHLEARRKVTPHTNKRKNKNKNKNRNRR